MLVSYHTYYLVLKYIRLNVPVTKITTTPPPYSTKYMGVTDIFNYDKI